MAKITLDTITSAYASTSLFQSNFSAIATELNDKVLYRVNPTGEANQMMNDLDMNSNDILNVDALDTTSLTVNGTAITPNTNDQTLTYIDTEYTNVATQDTFTVAYTVGFADVYINGVLLANADYTATNGTSIVLATPVTLASDVVTVRAFSSFSAGDGITQTTADARYLQGANNLSEITNKETSRNNIGIYSGNKNLIINGDMSVWQRGTSQTATGYGSVDRFQLLINGSTTTKSQQTFTLGQTDIPSNPTYYTRFANTSVAGANNYIIDVHKVEGIAHTAGREVTLSFYAKADAVKNMAVEFLQDFGAGGSPSTLVTGISVTTLPLTTDWVRQTVTATMPSISGKTLGTDSTDSLVIYFWFEGGADFDPRNNSLGQQSGTFDISNVQLEFGDTATEFEYVSPADQLARCQRYFERKNYASASMISTGQAYSTTAAFADLKFLEKRGTPTVVEGGAGTIQGANSASAATGTVSFSVINKESCRISVGGATGLVAGNASMVLSSGVTYIDIDAEL